MKVRLIKSAICFLVILLFASCGADSSAEQSENKGESSQTDSKEIFAEVKLAESDIQRDLSNSVFVSEIKALTDGNTKFALDLYFQIANESDNIFFSPFSISQALAMTYAGARGNTESQMESVLHLPGQTITHSVFNELDRTLASGDSTSEDNSFRLSIANSIWAQQGFDWSDDFLNILKASYGSGINAVDFETAFNGIRIRINMWVENETNDKIKDLIPEGVLNNMTRMVLVNAIYFFGKWTQKFDMEATYDREFYKLDKTTIEIPTMHQTSNFRYAKGDGYQVLQMEYRWSDMAMLIILPEKDRFSEIEFSLSYKWVEKIVSDLEFELVKVALPKIKMDTQFMLASTLKTMGMHDAFDPTEADFSGMNGERNLFISNVIHKAFLDIDEEGTEAAAATAVIIEMTSAPMEDSSPVIPKEFIADRPFIFMIRDTNTDGILFLGRILEPEK